MSPAGGVSFGEGIWMGEQTSQASGAEASGKPALRVVAVAGGKGGVGKTHLAVNLAVAFGRRGRRVLMIDGDVSLANSDMLLDVSPHAGLADVLSGACAIEDALTVSPHGVTLLAGAHGEVAASTLSDTEKLALLGALDGLGETFDTVVIDTAAGLGGNALFFAGGAQEVVIVTTPEPTALADTYATVRSLVRGSTQRRLGVVVNQARDGETAQFVYERLRALVRRFLSVEIDFIGWVPFDAHVHAAVMRRAPVLCDAPWSEASQHVIDIADRILAEGPVSERGQAGGISPGIQFFWRQFLASEIAGTH